VSGISNVAATLAWSEGHYPDGVRSAVVLPIRVARETPEPAYGCEVTPLVRPS